MFSKFITLPLFIAAGVVARPALMRRDSSIPPLSQWASSGFESFWTFKVRYTSLGCAEQQGSDFYNSCCTPLPANQTASAECTPTSLVCAGVNVFDPSASVTTSSSSPVPAPTDDSVNVQQVPDYGSTDNEDDYDESNLPYCEDPTDDGYYHDDDETTTTSYSDQSYTPPADSQQSSPSPTPDNSGSNDQSGYVDTGNTNTDTNNNSNNNSSGEIGDAFATYYYQGGNAGACGDYHGDYDLIGAIDIAWYGNTGERSQYCGRSVTVTNQNNGRSVTITVADVCPTCNTDNSFDLSVGAFQAIADLGDGLVPITWHFN